MFLRRLMDLFELHFAVMVLVLMFFGGSILLAHYGMHEEMSRWIEGSPVVVAIVAILKSNSGIQASAATEETTTTEEKKP